MRTAQGLVKVAVIVALALSFGACAGKVRVASKKMCEAHGGTYSAQTQACSYAQKTLTAKQTCQDQGGYYLPEEQYCEIEAGQ